MTTLRADLHVHSCFSRQSGNLKFLRSRDCYSPPDEVYRAAKARGMDLVTITDHDSIDGCLDFLDRHPGCDDFIVGEEVSSVFPGTGIQVHFGVYGMTEALHRAVQPLRGNAFDVAACLREAGVFFALNHLLHFYRGQIPLADYLRLVAEVPALEARNGTMLAAHNALIEGIAAGGASPYGAAGRLGVTGGSDAHTLRRVGTTWTEAPGRTRDEFLASLASGRAVTGGAHGSTAVIAADAYRVIGAYVGSLVGLGPRDHSAVRRTLCLAFSVVTLPAQFLPLVLAWNGKRHEARQVEALARGLDRALAGGGAAAS